MIAMSPVLRIKAELFLTAASKKLVAQHLESRSQPIATPQSDTVKVIRKEIDKLVEILANDASEKHFNVAARVAKCADYLAQISNDAISDARGFMVAAHKVLQDVEEITL
jgi:hypothetical protein